VVVANLAPIGLLHQPHYYVRFDSGHLPGLQHFTGLTAFLTATLGIKLEAVRFPFLPCRTLSQNLAFGAPGLLPLMACHAHRLNLSASNLFRIVILPLRRLPSKPNGARQRPAAHYAKALRAFDCCARSASVFQRQRDCHSGGLIAERTEHDQPTHRAYAVRKTGQDSIYWAEIGAA
jgi:hypothetical protein